jgi:hypothetical protein
MRSLRALIVKRKQAARRFILKALAGSFKDDLKTMGAIKVLTTTGARDRRLSTGQISNCVLDDEDYIEILKIGSFNLDGVEEARLSAAEAALEGHGVRSRRALTLKLDHPSGAGQPQTRPKTENGTSSTGC